MKTDKYQNKMFMKKLFFGILPVLFVVLTSRCTLAEDIEKLTGVADSLQLVVGTPKFETGVHLEFRNGKTNSYVDETDVEVRVSGKNAGDVYNNLGMKETPYITKLGILELIINPAKVDTAAMRTNPLEFEVTVTASGYNPVTQRVRLFGKGMEKVAITMIKLSDTPDGVTAQQASTFAVAGLTGTTVLPSTITMNGGDQNVRLGAGVRLKDAAGNPVSGTVSATVVYFDPSSQDAQDAFPGGLNVTAQMDNNTTEQIQFVSAGMFDLRLSAGGTPVKSFENGGITLSTTVPETLINPNTGQPVQANDVIELWSLDEGSGQWVFEKMDTVRLKNGKLTLEETVTHLSTWNWDFFYNSCTYGPKFVFRGALTNEYNYMKVKSQVQSSFYTKESFITFNTITNHYYNYLQLYNTPSGQRTSFTFEDAGIDPTRRFTFSPATFTIDNLCNGQVYYIDVTEEILPIEQVTVNIDISASSESNPQLVIRPNMYMYYLQTNSSYWNYNYMYLNNGKATINLQLNRNYTISGGFGNFYGWSSLKIDAVGTDKLKITMSPTIYYGNNTEQPSPVVMEVDRPANNIITVKYNAELPDDVFSKLQTRASL